jgi:uncharacterized membrane protein YbhN (UPF0104 family)
MHFELELRKRHAALFVGSIAALVAVVTMPQLLGDRVADAVDGLAAAEASWLWLAAFAFGGSLFASASGWASALTRCGGTTTRPDATARYCTGSLVNAVAPARLGSAVRFALFARVLPNEGRIWTAGGVATSLGAIRLLWLALVLALGSAFGQLPRWPIALLLLGVAAATAVAWRARNSRPGTRFAHVLDAFRVLGRCPRAAAQIAGWIGLGMGMRLVAAAGVAAAFGIDSPVTAALLIIPALDLAGLLPITPGNVGVASAAIAFVLAAQGVGSDLALSAGIAFGVVETLTTFALGCGSLLYFAGCRTDARRWRTAAVSVCGCLALGAAFSATVLVPLV